MPTPLRLTSARTTALLLLLSACTAPVEGGGVTLRLTTAADQSPMDGPPLWLEGQIVNATSEPFTNGGCTRPSIAIDSIGPTGTWGEIASSQDEELVVCIRAYTVDAGSTATFQAALSRSGSVWFPRGRLLRARIPVGPSRMGPSAEFVLPP